MSVKNRGFGAMKQKDPDRLSQLGHKGGKAAHQKGTARHWSSESAKAASQKGLEARRRRKAEKIGGIQPHPPSLQEIVDRMNWIGAQDSAVRETLRAHCKVHGHTPTGEKQMTNPPKDSCFHCGDEYR